LIIDEAQHLKPEVLEQLRLLTNLETNTKKLLQVILIGQPELQQLLQRRDLRQLAQRITARYHLLPLTYDELSLYIKHRLSVAQCTRSLFSKSAVKLLHKISGGVPRLVNLLCDRALILAYSNNQTLVSKKIIQQSGVEVLGDDALNNRFSPWTFLKVAAIGLLILLGGFISVQMVLNNQWLKADDNIDKNVVKTSQDDKNSLSGEVKNKAEPVQEVVNALTVENKLPQQESTLITLEKPVIKPVEDTRAALEPRLQRPRILGYQPEKITVLPEDEFEFVAEPGVSEDLLARFKEAINETPLESADYQRSDEENVSTEHEQYKPIHQMPTDIQDSLPALQFEMHIYATEGQGWVRVNGEDKREGDDIFPEVTLDKILPQHVVLTFKNEIFTMPALSNW